MRNNHGILRQARIDEESLLLLERAAHCYIRCLSLYKGFRLILPERSGHAYIAVLGFDKNGDEITMTEGDIVGEDCARFVDQVMEYQKALVGDNGCVYIPIQKNHKKPFGVICVTCQDDHQRDHLQVDNLEVDHRDSGRHFDSMHSVEYALSLGRQAHLSPRLMSEPLYYYSESGQIKPLNRACEDMQEYFGEGQDLFNIIAGTGFNSNVLEPFLDKKCRGMDVDVEGFSFMVTECPILTPGGSSGSLMMFSDTTEVRDMQQEVINKSTVIREIHHRVKNNLQTIASLLQLQSRRAGNSQVEKALAESINRISSIALIHEALSKEGKNTVNIKECIRSIMEMVLSNLLDSGKSIHGELKGPDIYLNSSQASHISLCVTELLLNAVEHAFVVRKKGNILATIEQIGPEVTIIVEDDGAGFQGKKTKGNSLGLQIIEMITAENLKGTFKLEAHTYGSKAEIRFPL